MTSFNRKKLVDCYVPDSPRMRSIQAGVDELGRPILPIDPHTNITDPYLRALLFGDERVLEVRVPPPPIGYGADREHFGGDAQIRHAIARDDRAFDGKNSPGFMHCGPGPFGYCVKN